MLYGVIGGHFPRWPYNFIKNVWYSDHRSIFLFNFHRFTIHECVWLKNYIDYVAFCMKSMVTIFKDGWYVFLKTVIYNHHLEHYTSIQWLPFPKKLAKESIKTKWYIDSLANFLINYIFYFPSLSMLEWGMTLLYILFIDWLSYFWHSLVYNIHWLTYILNGAR